MTVRFQRQKPKLTAAEINRWNRLANAFHRGELNRPFENREPDLRKPDFISGEWIWIENVGDQDRQVYEAVSVGDPIYANRRIPPNYTPTEDLIFRIAPENRWRPVAVLLEPIPAGGIGRAQVSGMSLALIENENSPTDYGYAYLNERANRLRPSNAGNCRLYSFYDPIFYLLQLVELNCCDTGLISWPFQAKNNSASVGTFEPLATYTSGGVRLDSVREVDCEYMYVEDIALTGTNPAMSWRFHRPGIYRIDVEIEASCTNAANNAATAGRWRWFEIGGSEVIAPEDFYQYSEASTAFTGIDKTHCRTQFLDVSEGGEYQMQLGATTERYTAADVEPTGGGKLVLTLVEPRQSSVGYNHPYDNNPWNWPLLPVVVAPATNALQLETGDRLLVEDGNTLGLE